MKGKLVSVVAVVLVIPGVLGKANTPVLTDGVARVQTGVFNGASANTSSPSNVMVGNRLLWVEVEKLGLLRVRSVGPEIAWDTELTE